MTGREPESHLHLGQAALALNPRAALSPPVPLPAAAAASHVALDTRAHQLFHTYVDVQKHASTFNLNVCFLQRKYARTLSHKHTNTFLRMQTSAHWSELSDALILQIKAKESWVEIHFYFFPDQAQGLSYYC